MVWCAVSMTSQERQIKTDKKTEGRVGQDELVHTSSVGYNKNSKEENEREALTYFRRTPGPAVRWLMSTC